MIHNLNNVHGAVAAVKVAKPKDRREIIARFLEGKLDYDSSTGRIIGNRRALFVSALSAEKLWP